MSFRCRYCVVVVVVVVAVVAAANWPSLQESIPVL